MSVCECGARPTADIGIEVRGVYDGVIVYRCWSCGKYRPRFTEGRRHDIGTEIAQTWNAR